MKNFFNNIKDKTSGLTSAVWEFYIEFLDWCVFSTVGATSTASILIAMLMTTMLICIIGIFAVLLLAIAYGTIILVFSNFPVFFVIVSSIALLFTIVKCAVKSWSKKNHE